MRFNLEIMKNVLTYIETRITFTGNNINNLQDWNIKYDISIKDIIKTYRRDYPEDDIRYCIWLLREINYIDFSKDSITKVTPEGYKFMLNILHNVNCMY